MRNTLQYPITYDEITNYLQRLIRHDDKVIGNMENILMNNVLKIVQNHQKINEDLNQCAIAMRQSNNDVSPYFIKMIENLIVYQDEHGNFL